ncbi:copper uptake system-associated protein [Agrobacterium pusense]|uniref:copper uptake system-associated protein n=1 Tax=Agrobacterium pusense TaxID=648995 RepID=UPI003D105F1E
MMRILFRLLAIILALTFPVVVHAHGFKIGEVQISHPYARAMLPGAKLGGGYLKIVNDGAADRLVSAKSDRATSVQLHEMKMDGGIMIMRELKDGITIPANTTVELKPGGYHVMFMNVTRPLKEGEMVKATLFFEKAGTVEVEFQVGPAAGGTPEMKHGDHANAYGDHTSAQTEAHVSGDAMKDIPAKMKAIFETADTPLSVEPVVIQGEWAIAGWTQDGKGGRALLKKTVAGWSIHLCSGDGLKDARGLRMMGLPETDATAIAAKLTDAEKHIPAAKLALFASFEGTVMVEGDEASAVHGEHQGHGK